jgi:small subunit ribosomal protein S2
MKKKGISLEDLLEAGCHFGHQAKRWHPKMAPYIWTVRNGVHIFDLAKTKGRLEKAARFAKVTADKGGKIIFIGTKRQAKAVIKEEAERCGMPYVDQRWLGGTITNWEQIKKSIKKLTDMREKREKGEYEKYTKKENILINREIARLEKLLGGLIDLQELPEAVFVVDCKKEEAVVKEANMKGVKVIGIVDTNTNPTDVDYVIPANDDAVGSIKLITSMMAEAIIKGKKK